MNSMRELGALLQLPDDHHLVAIRSHHRDGIHVYIERRRGGQYVYEHGAGSTFPVAVKDALTKIEKIPTPASRATALHFIDIEL